MNGSRWIIEILFLVIALASLNCGVKGTPVPYVLLDEDSSGKLTESERQTGKEMSKKQDAKSQLNSAGISEKGKD